MPVNKTIIQLTECKSNGKNVFTRRMKINREFGNGEFKGHFDLHVRSSTTKKKTFLEMLRDI